MRKATALTTLVMLGGFGALFFLADTALKPLAQDGRVGQDLTRWLVHRGDIETSTKARVRFVRGGRGEGRGLRIRLVPSEAVRVRPHAMTHLAQRAAEQALEAYDLRRPAWVDAILVLEAGEPPREAQLRLRVTDEGLVAEGPPLPRTWPPVETARRPRPLPAPACAPSDGG